MTASSTFAYRCTLLGRLNCYSLYYTSWSFCIKPTELSYVPLQISAFLWTSNRYVGFSHPGNHANGCSLFLPRVMPDFYGETTLEEEYIKIPKQLKVTTSKACGIHCIWARMRAKRSHPAKRFWMVVVKIYLSTNLALRWHLAFSTFFHFSWQIDGFFNVFF